MLEFTVFCIYKIEYLMLCYSGYFAFDLHANSQCILYVENIIYKLVLSMVTSNFGCFKN